MADTKISELPVATAIASPDAVPIVQDGVTKQALVSLFRSFLKFIGLDFTGNNLTFMNGTTMWKSTGDSNDQTTNPYTPTTSGIVVKDANNDEIWRLWANADNVSGSSIFLGAHAGENLTDVSDKSVVIGNHTLPQQTNTNSGNTIIGYRAGGSLTGDTDVVGFQNTLIGEGAAIYTATRDAGTQNVSQAVVVGGGANAVGNQSVAIGYAVDALGTNQIAIGVGAELHLDNPDNIVLIGNGDITDAYFGSLAGLSILHGKGNAIVFPDSDPHVAGAAYWVLGVLTKSAG